MINPARMQNPKTLWVWIFLGSLLVLFSVDGLAATDYSGQWEYQALNAGDTNFKVEHQGESITFYRVLYPRYQGERYKLEHIYRGKLTGDSIAGEMWVREEGVDEFERLRVFRGRIESTLRMTMDDMPLQRVESTVKTEPQSQPKRQAQKDNADLGLHVPQTRSAQPTKQVVVSQNEVEKSRQKNDSLIDYEQHDKQSAQKVRAVSAPQKIPQLTMVNRKLKSSRVRQAEKLLSQGDHFYANKDFQQAVKRYQQALRLDSKRVELYYKLGLGHGILGSAAAKKKAVSQARQHLELAIDFWNQAVRLDPYNTGAKENIKRAHKKLLSL